jgi:hypothetical protein
MQTRQKIRKNAFRLERFNQLCALAKSKRGVLLSSRYVDNKTKLRWRCAKGHEWDAIPSNVRRGHWCKICGNDQQGRAKAHTIEMMRKAAAKRMGECLSATYKNNLTKLRWRCKHGHEWEAVPGSIVGSGKRKGSWCPRCIGKLPKSSALEELKKLAIQRGGELISKRYLNARSHLVWKCSHGHQWRAVPYAVKNGTWCPVCGGSHPLNLAQMQKTARDFGGLCLSKEYANTSERLLWRCAQGHEWEAKPSHVLDGHWCPICSGGVSERICRALLERMTNAKFSKARPAWLLNDRGQQMELDGFAPALSLGFEYQGVQHFVSRPFFHADAEMLKRRKQDDERKRQLCQTHRVTLLEIPYTISNDEMQNYLVKLLEQNAPGLTFDKLPIRIQDLDVWRRKDLEDLRLLAKARGGKLISNFYVNNNTKMLWRCSLGHEWEAVSSSIKQGSWCPKCGNARAAKKRSRSIDDMRQYATSRGGECLSRDYQNSKSRLRWRCAKGHEWIAQASSVIVGHWCPKCGKEKIARLFALSIEDMKAAAKKRGGMCLSKKYENQRSRLRWRCAHGHEWEALSMNIRHGSWCPICAGKKPKLVC